MKAFGGVVVQLHTFLTLILDGKDWSVSVAGWSTAAESAAIDKEHIF
jgi:hypothetical protein